MDRLCQLLVGLLCIFVANTQNEESSGRTNMVVVDVESRTVYRVDLGQERDDHNVEVYPLPIRRSIQDIAYDYINDRIYYYTFHSRIESAFVNGTDRRTNYVFSMVGSGFAFTMDPVARKIFRDTHRHTKQIKMANIDGSEEHMLTETRGYVAEMITHPPSRTLYWYDRDCGCIFKISYDGGNAMEMPRPRGMLFKPFGLDIENNVGYGLVPRGMVTWRLNETRYTRINNRRMFHGQTDLILDPKSQRLILYNNDLMSHVDVYWTNGTRFDRLDYLNMTSDGKKFARVNPL